LGNPSTLLKTFTLPLRLRRVKLGERFLLIQSEPRLILDSGLNLEFVSIENGESRNLILNYSGYTYAGGLVFQLLVKGIVLVWDPTSGTYFRDLRLPLQNEDRFIKFLPRTSVNSKYIVVGWKYNNENMHSYLSVYDLQAIKNSNSDPNRHLLYTLEVPLEVESFVMNEIQIICKVVNRENYNNLIVINFAKLAFNGKSSLRKNYRANKKIEIKIISGPCVHRDFFAK